MLSTALRAESFKLLQPASRARPWMVTIPNQSSVAKAYNEFDDD